MAYQKAIYFLSYKILSSVTPQIKKMQHILTDQFQKRFLNVHPLIYIEIHCDQYQSWSKYFGKIYIPDQSYEKNKSSIAIML